MCASEYPFKGRTRFSIFNIKTGQIYYGADDLFTVFPILSTAFLPRSGKKTLLKTALAIDKDLEINNAASIVMLLNWFTISTLRNFCSNTAKSKRQICIQLFGIGLKSSHKQLIRTFFTLRIDSRMSGKQCYFIVGPVV